MYGLRGSPSVLVDDSVLPSRDHPYQRHRASKPSNSARESTRWGLASPENLALYLPWNACRSGPVCRSADLGPIRSQGSVYTVLTLFGIMNGVTSTVLPTGFLEAGLATSVALTVVVGLLSYHTADLIVRDGGAGYCYRDFSELAGESLGPWARVAALVSSITIIMGALVGYHMLMVANIFDEPELAAGCGAALWCSRAVVSSLLGLPLFLLSSTTRTALLARLSVVGTICVVGQLVSASTSAMQAILDPAEPNIEWSATSLWFGSGRWAPGALSGLLFMSFYIHSFVLQVLNTHARPQRATRDLRVSYSLVWLSYVVGGVAGALQQHIYREAGMPNGGWSQGDWGTFATRLLTSVHAASFYPMLAVIVRGQLAELIALADRCSTRAGAAPAAGAGGVVVVAPGSGAGGANDLTPGRGVFAGWAGQSFAAQSSGTVVILNLLIIGTSTSMAAAFSLDVFSAVVRFTGVVGGFIHVLVLPIGVHLKEQRAQQYDLSKRAFLCSALFCREAAVFIIGVVCIGLEVLRSFSS